MNECEFCAFAGTPAGSCDRCIESGRHEHAGRVFQRRQQVRRPDRGEIWLKRYQDIFFGAPHIPAVPANASPEVLGRVRTAMVLKGLTAALGATLAVLQAA